jgi:glycosyltransferase involved in cell wall biosynthesis
MRIIAHTLVKNEAKYLWFAVRSVVDHVDKVMLWDTGSTDETPIIIEKLITDFPHKISFKEVGPVTPAGFPEIRQQMLKETDGDWIIIVDGDEVWWNNSIQLIKETINIRGDNLDTIVNPYYNLIGDIYHIQEEKAGKYEIDGRVGHITIHAINRKIPGLHIKNPHGTQGFFDGDNVLIQNRPTKKRIFLNAPFLHFTHLQRSGLITKEIDVPKRMMKLKHEIGISVPNDFYYPESFFYKKPNIVASPWIKMSSQFYFRSALETPLRRIKRRLLKSKVGY